MNRCDSTPCVGLQSTWNLRLYFIFAPYICHLMAESMRAHLFQTELGE